MVAVCFCVRVCGWRVAGVMVGWMDGYGRRLAAGDATTGRQPPERAAHGWRRVAVRGNGGGSRGQPSCDLRVDDGKGGGERYPAAVLRAAWRLGGAGVVLYCIQ